MFHNQYKDVVACLRRVHTAVGYFRRFLLNETDIRFFVVSYKWHCLIL